MAIARRQARATAEKENSSTSEPNPKTTNAKGTGAAKRAAPAAAKGPVNVGKRRYAQEDSLESSGSSSSPRPTKRVKGTDAKAGKKAVKPKVAKGLNSKQAKRAKEPAKKTQPPVKNANEPTKTVKQTIKLAKEDNKLAKKAKGAQKEEEETSKKPKQTTKKTKETKPKANSASFDQRDGFILHSAQRPSKTIIDPKTGNHKLEDGMPPVVSMRRKNKIAPLRVGEWITGGKPSEVFTEENLCLRTEEPEPKKPKEAIADRVAWLEESIKQKTIPEYQMKNVLAVLEEYKADTEGKGVVPKGKGAEHSFWMNGKKVAAKTAHAKFEWSWMEPALGELEQGEAQCNPVIEAFRTHNTIPLTPYEIQFGVHEAIPSADIYYDDLVGLPAVRFRNYKLSLILRWPDEHRLAKSLRGWQAQEYPDPSTQWVVGSTITTGLHDTGAAVNFLNCETVNSLDVDFFYKGPEIYSGLNFNTYSSIKTIARKVMFSFVDWHTNQLLTPVRECFFTFPADYITPTPEIQNLNNLWGLPALGYDAWFMTRGIHRPDGYTFDHLARNPRLFRAPNMSMIRDVINNEWTNLYD